MTSTITVQKHRRPAIPDIQAQVDRDRAKLADEARRVLASRCSDAAELREVAEMLGLVRTDPETGATVAADPWAEEAGLQSLGRPRG